MRVTRLVAWLVICLGACDTEGEDDPRPEPADAQAPSTEGDARDAFVQDAALGFDAGLRLPGGSTGIPPLSGRRDAGIGTDLNYRGRGDAGPSRDANWSLPDSSAAFGDADLWAAPPPAPVLPSASDPDGKALATEASRKRALDLAGVTQAYPVKLAAGVSYDANQAQFMDRIQASALSLTEAERMKLGQNGFVISTRREFPSFVHGLAAIYSEHLPLYLSADTLLHTVHQSYESLFKRIELAFLQKDLGTLLRDMHGRLALVEGGDPLVLRGVDEYLCVAIGLLDRQQTAPAPVQGGDPAHIRELIGLAVAAQGVGAIDFFGLPRMVDFSQFTVRGHYASNPLLAAYFRTMMWLGRMDFRLIENEQGMQTFRRPQYEAMLLMQTLWTGSELTYDRIEGVLRTFVGQSDSLNPPGARRLIEELGGMAVAKAASDATALAAIRAGNYGTQRIASQLVFGDQDHDGKPDPLDHAYLLLGQRYLVDSHALSDAVYDRVQSRLMANPLDAAFAALGNSQALLLDEDAAHYPDLAGAMAATRTVIDAHAPDFWNESFYNQWLRALRALSPLPDPASVAGLPQIARSEAWGRRVLNTQLGSWVELRHDTVLYSKQSYTGIPICDYPDVYVDPYPGLYHALHDYALAGLRMAERLPFPPEDRSVGSYFAALEEATRVIGDMAERELRGEPFSAEQMAFINDAVRIVGKDVICSTIDAPDGWYANLFLDRQLAIEADLIVSDVHTQPADASGNLVGYVLHAGTGFPRQLVASVDTCMGPRAYVGVVYAYHEEIAKDFQRYQDQAWAQRFLGPNPSRPAEVPWLTDVQAH